MFRPPVDLTGLRTSTRDSGTVRPTSAVLIILLAATRMTDGYAQRIEQVVDSLVQADALRRGVPGVSVVIVSDGSIVIQRGYGSADVASGRAVNAATPFNIASITKPFTAAVVLMLEAEGRVRLDAPAGDYLPLPTRYDSVTVRQLLTHTSGVVRDLRLNNDDDPDADEYRRRLERAEASARPGERFEYSNTGYTVLGWLVEAVEGRPLEEVFRRRIFDPLGMRQARYRAPLSSDPDRARPHEVAGGAARAAAFVSGGFGSGGISLSATDLAGFAVGLQTGRFLPRAALDPAWTPGRLADGKPAVARVMTDSDAYGFGWFITRFAGRRLLTHGGGITGYSANLYHFPDERLTIAVLANVKGRDDGQAPVDPLARRIAEACFARESCRPAAGSRALRDTIGQLNRNFSEAYLRGDTAAIRSMYASDPVALPPHGRAVTGAGPVARLFRTSGSARHVHHALYTERLDPYGDTVVELGTWYDVWDRDGQVTASTGRYVLTWVRSGGEWRIAADAWQSTPQR